MWHELAPRDTSSPATTATEPPAQIEQPLVNLDAKPIPNASPDNIITENEPNNVPFPSTFRDIAPADTQKQPVSLRSYERTILSRRQRQYTLGNKQLTSRYQF